jgi:enoyl-CoA hydratase/carnithine racemase
MIIEFNSPGHTPESLRLHRNQIKNGLIEGAPALILKGNRRFFSLGVDGHWYIQATPIQRKSYFCELYDLIEVILTAPIPTVAIIEGNSYGSGAVLGLICDQVVGTEASVICLPELKLGYPIPKFVIDLLATLTCKKVLFSLLFGRALSGEEAAEAGLIHQLVDDPSEYLSYVSSLGVGFDKDALRITMQNFRYPLIQSIGQYRTISESMDIFLEDAYSGSGLAKVLKKA